MVGVYEAGTVLEWGTLFLSDNQFWYSVGQTKIKAYRAYFDYTDLLPDFENSSDSRSINMAFVEDVAGINEIMHPEHAAKDCYDLQGRKVAKLGRGIFVKNGKKVVVK